MAHSIFELNYGIMQDKGQYTTTQSVSGAFFSQVCVLSANAYVLK